MTSKMAKLLWETLKSQLQMSDAAKTQLRIPTRGMFVVQKFHISSTF